MDHISRAVQAGAESVRLSHEHTRAVLHNAFAENAEPAAFEALALDREAAAVFVARQAALLSAIAHAGGLPTAKILCDMLYANAFTDAANADLA